MRDDVIVYTDRKFFWDTFPRVMGFLRSHLVSRFVMM